MLLLIPGALINRNSTGNFFVNKWSNWQNTTVSLRIDGGCGLETLEVPSRRVFSVDLKAKNIFF